MNIRQLRRDVDKANVRPSLLEIAASIDTRLGWSIARALRDRCCAAASHSFHSAPLLDSLADTILYRVRSRLAKGRPSM